MVVADGVGGAVAVAVTDVGVTVGAAAVAVVLAGVSAVCGVTVGDASAAIVTVRRASTSNWPAARVRRSFTVAPSGAVH